MDDTSNRICNRVLALCCIGCNGFNDSTTAPAMALDERDFVTSALAGLVVICATMLVEKCGGVIGGVIGMVPHVAVFGSVVFFLKRDDSDSGGDVFLEGTLSMPLGMLSNALLQASLRAVARAPAASLRRLAPALRLAACVAAGLSTYFTSAAALVRVFTLRRHDDAWLWAVSAASFGLHACVGSAMLRSHVPAPRGRKASSRAAVLGRGLVTGAIFLLAMHIADEFPALAGILVNFPFVTIAMVGALWLGQGEDVAVGALSPMALGMLSAALHALLAAVFMPRWESAALGAVAAWFAAVGGVSVPLAHLLRRLHRARAAAEAEAGAKANEAEAVAARSAVAPAPFAIAAETDRY